MPTSTTTPAQETPAPSSPDPAQEHSRAEHELYLTKFAIRLFVILCLGALASFELAPHFLPQPSHANVTVTTRQYTDGACTTEPQAIIYLQTTRQTTSAPTAWTKAGKNSEEFARAQACAAAFTIAYNTFDSNNPPSLTNAVSMLSSIGKAHFFVGSRAEPKDPRVDATWQTRARKEHLQHSAQMLTTAQLQTVLFNNGVFSAVFTTSYELTTKMSGTSTTQHKSQVVVLATASITASDPSTGWRVADWYNMPTKED